MVMLPSAATPLLRSLNNLGAPRKQRESIAEQVAREGMSWWGAERRVLALEERLGLSSASAPRWFRFWRTMTPTVR